MKKEALIIFLALTIILFNSNVSVNALCTPNWTCTQWSKCIGDNSQIRSCIDTNTCEDNSTRPIEIQSCIAECTPDWECTKWQPEICPENQTITRECIDLNNCKIITGEQEPEIKSCIYKRSANWVFIAIIILIVAIILGDIYLIFKKAIIKKARSFQKQTKKALH